MCRFIFFILKTTQHISYTVIKHRFSCYFGSLFLKPQLVVKYFIKYTKYKLAVETSSTLNPAERILVKVQNNCTESVPQYTDLKNIKNPSEH